MTQEEISYLGDLTSELLQPTKDFLLKEICRRVAKAGKMTSTAEYQAYRAKALGIEWGDIQKELKRQGTVSDSVIDNIFGKLSQDAIGIEDNESLLKMLKAYKNTVKSDFKSISKEMGIVAPDGKQYPIFDTVGKTMDYAFKQVFTGSQDYTSALRAATRELVNKGIRTMPRQNAKSVTIEYAARQRLMNSLGLMNEAIVESNYNELGCDGWEISAHGGSAPDHEPVQGHQYSNVAYKALNANLQRRIGTLSCKHTASPIILGVNSPQYTQAELKAFQTENAKGITYQGRHYTLYEATQQQRSCEASIRRQKYHCLADAELGDKEKLITDQIRLNITREQYLRFSRAAGLPTQNERAQVAGFGRSEASKASAAYRKNIANNKAYSDREFSIKPVTEESIEAVLKIYGENFTDVQADNLQRAHRQLLRFVINEDLGMEAGVYLDKDMLPLTDFVLGEIGRLNMPPSTQSAKVFIHNHPSGELFSIDDISNFTTDANLDILTAVGNDGSLYMLEKTGEYNFSEIQHLYIRAALENPTSIEELPKIIKEREVLFDDFRRYGLNYTTIRNT